MTRFEELNSILAHLPSLARSVDLLEAAQWSDIQHARFRAEIRWCREALGELDTQVEAAIRQVDATG